MKKQLLVTGIVATFFATSYAQNETEIQGKSSKTRQVLHKDWAIGNKGRGAGGSGAVARTRSNFKDWGNTEKDNLNYKYNPTTDFQYGKGKPYKTKEEAQKAARKYLRQAIQQELNWAPVNYQKYGFQVLSLNEVRDIYREELQNYLNPKKAAAKPKKKKENDFFRDNSTWTKADEEAVDGPGQRVAE